MTPQELRELLTILRDFQVSDYKSDQLEIHMVAQSLPTPLQAKLQALQSNPIKHLKTFAHQPEVQYLTNAQSSIQEQELLELGFAGVQPQQKKKARITKPNQE